MYIYVQIYIVQGQIQHKMDGSEIDDMEKMVTDMDWQTTKVQ